MGWSIGNAFIMEITPPMISGIGWITFIILAALNFLTIPIVWAFYPETSNKQLEEMDAIFATKSSLVFKAEKELAKIRERNGGSLALSDTDSRRSCYYDPGDEKKSTATSFHSPATYHTKA